MPGSGEGTIGVGDLSPDGTRFAYEVGRSDRRGELRVLDLGTREGRVAGDGPGRRADPAWSPDGRRIAFWDDEPGRADSAEGRDGIWVLDLDSGRERRVFRAEDHTVASSPSWLGPDTIRFAYWRGSLDGGRETWIVAADGTGGRRVAEAEVELLPVRAPEGAARAHVRGCCGVWARGLWVASAEGERCVAGPMDAAGFLVWSPDASRLHFLGRARDDSVLALWTTEVARGGARRIETPAGTLTGLTRSAAGVLAVQIRSASDSAFLWVVDDPAGLPRAADSIPDCPEPDAALVRFVRREGIEGELRFRELLGLPERDVLLFAVGYDFSRRGRRSRAGLKVADHIGWVAGPCRVGPFGDRSCDVDRERLSTFVPREGEEVLWSSEFLERLAEIGWERRWVDVLLRDREPPADLLSSLLAQGRFDDRLLEHPRVRERVDWLLQIRGRHPERSRVETRAFEALRALGPAAVHAPGTPHGLLRRFARRARARPDSLAGPIGRALLTHPEAGGDTAILLDLARVPPEVDPNVFRRAGERLLENPSVSADQLEAAVATMAADSALAERLFLDPRVREDLHALLPLARTPWHDWSVARRAREILRDLAARRAEAAGPGVILGAPVMLPSDPWEGIGPFRERRRDRPVLDPATASLLRHLDPVWDLLSEARTVPVPGAPTRQRIERRVCRIAAAENAPASDLARIAENAVYATSTRIAACLLDNPRVRQRAELLRLLSTMVDLNDHPDLPGPGAPTIAEVRSRAEGMLRSSDPG